MLVLVVALVAGVFALVVYINTQNARSREHTDRQIAGLREDMIALRDHFDAKFDSLRDYMGDRIYDHEGRLTELETKDRLKADKDKGE